MDEMKRGFVSIIVVTWNGERFIEDCLSSIYAQDYAKFEIILVDNSSTDSTMEVARKKFGKSPNLTIIENDLNRGFCAANNIGLSSVEGEFVLFLNPDTKMAPDFLDIALKEFEDPAVGSVSGKILRFDGKTIDSAGQFLGRNRRPIERGYGTVDKDEYTLPRRCFSVCGAAALYRRDLVEILKINGQFFDEDYFAFYEDLDTGWRMNLYGFECRYAPSAVIYHHRGGSKPDKKGLAARFQIAGRPPAIQAAIIRNRWYTIIKNDSVINYLLDFPFIMVQELKTVVYMLFFRLDIILPVYGGFFRELPSLLSKRRKIRSKAKFSSFNLRGRI